MAQNEVELLAEDAAAIASTAAALEAANIRARDMFAWVKTQMTAEEDSRVTLFALTIVERHICKAMERHYGVPAAQVAAMARASLIELAEVEE
jgi:hypothetical protein